jgi:hypothetical protein
MMGRVEQQQSSKGSQRWIQELVNNYPKILEDAIGIGRIDWLSPRDADDYAEYRDQAFLDHLKINSLKRPLSSFWPTRGPQWDALGRAETGEAVLVECKAHIGEIFSPPSRACASSARIIRRSLEETKVALGALPGMDWTLRFYQYANRIAHAHFLQNLNNIPTKLVFLYIIGDIDMQGPSTRAEWEAAIAVLHEALGMRGRIPRYVRDAFVDVGTGMPIAN